MGNELHTMPLKLEKLLSSSFFRGLEWDLKGAYILLLGEAWLEGGKLENNPDSIRRCIGTMSDDDWNRIKTQVLNKKFIPDANGKYLVNSTEMEIYNSVLAEIKSNSNRGLRGADARWKPKQCSSNAQAKQTHPPSNGNQSQSQIQNQTHSKGEPITYNPLEREPTPEEVKEISEAYGIICTIDRASEFIEYYAGLGWKKHGGYIIDWRRFVKAWTSKPSYQAPVEQVEEVEEEQLRSTPEEKARLEKLFPEALNEI